MSEADSVEQANAVALAALTVCESLFVVLTEKGILGSDEALILLEDAVDSHLDAAKHSDNPELHKRTAKVVKFIMAKSNSTRASAKIGNIVPLFE